MNCLCDGTFKCSVCQVKEMMRDRAASYVAGLDEYELFQFMKEIYTHSPNIKKMIEIKISADLVISAYKNLIHCPLCETKHENNTMCQANFEPDHSPE